MSSARSSSQVNDALSQFSSCEIGDALTKLGVPNSGFLYGITIYSPDRQRGPTKVLGPAYTVQLVRAGDTLSPQPSQHFVDCIPKDSIVFVSQPAHFSACWGSMMSTRARILGAKGVVIDGNFRDVNDHIEMAFPLFARGTGVPGNFTYSRPSAINVPVKFKCDLPEVPEITIRPGDWILGDADGVVVIPVEIIEQVIEVCERSIYTDRQIMEGLQTGDEFGPTVRRLRDWKE